MEERALLNWLLRVLAGGAVRSMGKLVAVLAVAVVIGCGGGEERAAKYLDRGKALFEEGDYVKARLEFQNAVQIKPTSVRGSGGARSSISSR
jgi:hypothetical protein